MWGKLNEKGPCFMNIRIIHYLFPFSHFLVHTMGQARFNESDGSVTQYVRRQTGANHSD